MAPFLRFAITAIGLCSILAAAGACSSDAPFSDDRDAQASDVSRDGESSSDAVTPDTEVRAMDAVAMDVTRSDASDVESGDAPFDASLSDRNSNDASSVDRASGDSLSTDTSPTDSSVGDAPPNDSTSTDTPAADSTAGDAPSADSTSPDVRPGDGGNDPGCPPSWGPGGQCSGNVTCVYPEGACQCLVGCGAVPPPDAGNHWFCGTRGAGCPMQKPAVGTACSMDAQSCNYGTCCTDVTVCENGAWKQGSILCPP